MGGVLYTTDYSGCKFSDKRPINEMFLEALKRADAHLVPGTGSFYKFPNGAISMTVILQESHAAIHTWPESQFVTFELFTCGETVNALTAINYLADKLQCSDYDTGRHPRFPKKNETVQNPFRV